VTWLHRIAEKYSSGGLVFRYRRLFVKSLGGRHRLNPSYISRKTFIAVIIVDAPHNSDVTTNRQNANGI
jgi:hypothetical protein